MKLAKLFLTAAIFTVILSSKSLPQTFKESLPIKNGKEILKEIKSSVSLLYEYRVIDGVTWVFIYDNDGKLIDCYPFE